MNGNNSIDDELRKVVERGDCPTWGRATALAVIDTRKDVKHLGCVVKKIYRYQIAIISTLITSIILAFIYKLL